MQPSHLSVSAANVRRRLTKDSVSELMHGPPAPKHRHNHHADNLRKLGELARDAAARREEEAAPPPEPFKLSRFARVESRLAQSGALTRSPPKAPGGRPGSGAGSDPTHSPGSGDALAGGAEDDDGDDGDAGHNAAGGGSGGGGGGGARFLRKKAFVDPASVLPRPFVRPPPAGSLAAAAPAPAERRKSAVPRAEELARAAREREAAAAAARSEAGARDFQAENARAAMAERARAADVDPAQPLPKAADYGRLPGYLRDRKEAWAAEAEAKRQAELEAAGCPRGHRLMPEAERLETLALMRAACDEAQDALQRMPLRVEIPSAVRKKQELEAKVNKLEEALKVFQRPRVFVKIDA